MKLTTHPASFLRRTAAAVFAAALSYGTLAANESEPIARVAIGAEIGTAGYGPVAVITANKYLTASVGYTWLDFEDTYDSDDASYDGKLKFSNIQARLNWHPFAGNFHLSAGAFISDNTVDIVGRPKADSTYEFGGNVYTAAEVGTVAGRMNIVDDTVPFVGLGWTKTPAKSGFGFFFEVGVLFIDAPQATLTSRGGTLSNDPELKAALAREVDDINDDLKDLEFYPVVQLGLIYRF